MASYTPIGQLPGDKHFLTAGVKQGGTILAPTGKAAELWGAGVTIDYVEATDTFTLHASTGETASFDQSNRSIFYNFPVLAFGKTNPDSSVDSLTLITPGNPGQLRYTASGSWVHSDSPSNTVPSKAHYFVTGIPTIQSDIPTTGTASYYFKAVGSIIDNSIAYNVYAPETTGTVSANFANGVIFTSLHLVGKQGTNPSIDFGTYSGTGTLASGGPGFSGTLNGASVRTGVFSGAFFGPQALEIGYGWEIQGTNFDAQGFGVGLSVARAAESYQKLSDLEGDLHFSSGGITFQGTPLLPTNQTAKAYGSGFKVDYDATADSYSLSTTTGGVTMTPANVNSGPLPANVRQWIKTVNNVTDTFTLVTSTINGVPLSYTAIAQWNHVDTGNSANTIYNSSVSGVPTGLDMPTTGTATYTGSTGGALTDNGTNYNITPTQNVSLSANFGTGALTTTLTLVGTPVGGSVTTGLGTYTGTGTIGVGLSSFQGTLSGASGRSGAFSGAFFGPGAAEMGFGWTMQGTGFTAQGLAVGKQP